MVDYADIVLKLKQKGDLSLLQLAEADPKKMKAVRESLLKVLHDELNSMPASNDISKYKYIYKIFKYLEEPFNKAEKNKIIRSLESSKKLCERRISKCHGSKHNKNKTKVFEKIKDVIDVTIINLDYYDIEDNKEETSYNLLIYLIFKIKNYNYLFEIIKTYPDKIVAKNKNGKYLIEELIDRYLCEMIENDISGEVIYLEKVIKLFIDNPKLNLSSEDTIRIINKLNHSINEVNNIALPDAKKRKIIFFINEVIIYIDKNNYSVTEIINRIKEQKQQEFPDMSNKDKDLLNYFLDELYVIIMKQKYNYETIQKLNSYIMEIDKLKISDDIKDSIINLAYIIMNHLSNNIASSQINDYLYYKYDIDTTFSAAALNEAKNIVILDNEQVLDCTDKFTITIDGKRTKVYDDAISLEKFSDGTRLLGIYLADCASFIKRGSAIDQKAYALGETVNGRYQSMLPLDLVSKLSLTKDGKRRAVGYFFLFDENMKCISFSVKKCLIHVDENYDYERSNALLADSRNIDEVKTLKEMLLVSRNLSKLNYAKMEFRAVKNIKRKLINQEENDTASSVMIADFMIYINAFVANFFMEHPEIPFIYRNNLANYGNDVIDRINKIMVYDSDYEYVIPYINAICPPSYYSINNQGHRGLNLKAYCHATNPIRNYCSLEIQRLIEKYMINKDMQVSDTEKQRLKELCTYLNSRNDLNDEYVEELYKLKNKQKSLTN